MLVFLLVGSEIPQAWSMVTTMITPSLVGTPEAWEAGQ